MRNTLDKVMKQIYLKTASVAVKVPLSAKLSVFKVSSVAKIVTPATYGKDKEVYPYDLYFKVGSIVSIDGRDLDGHRFSNRDTAPIFFVGRTTLLNDIGWGDAEFYFVTNGDYEWVDKRKSHLMTSVWSHSKISECTFLIPQVTYPRMNMEQG